jgi:cell wall assembly regulator SMI1
MTVPGTANAGDLLLAHWNNTGRVLLAPGRGEKGVRQLEDRLGLVVPSDFRSYLCAVDGFAGPVDQDRNGFRFWPSREITTVDLFRGGQLASPETHGLVLFADYLDWSWGYAVTMATEPNERAGVYIIGTADGRPHRIARSFAEFSRLYTMDDPRLYG